MALLPVGLLLQEISNSCKVFCDDFQIIRKLYNFSDCDKDFKVVIVLKCTFFVENDEVCIDEDVRYSSRTAAK